MLIKKHHPRKPLDSFAALIMASLCACWAMQQIVIKLAASGMEPVLQVGLRSAGAAFLVSGFMVWRGEKFDFRDHTLRPGLIVGLLFGATFLCISEGLNCTTASHMAVFLYTAPIFTALGLHWHVPGERLRAAQWSGVFVAFVGIAVAFSNGFANRAKGAETMLIGDCLGVLGGVFWAATTVLIRCSTLSEAPPSKTLLYQLVGGAAFLLLVSAAAPPIRHHEINMTPTVWWSLAFQVVIVGFASFLTWFWMLRHYLASRLTVFSFMTPLFGVTFGVLLLKERLDVRFMSGALFVLAGIILVNLRGGALQETLEAPAEAAATEGTGIANATKLDAAPAPDRMQA